MKKFIKRRLPALMIVFIMIISFTLPTFAASDGWVTAVFNSYDSQIVNFADGSSITGVRDPDGKAMAWQLPGSGPWVGNSVRFFVKANMSVALNVGDRFNIKSKTIYGWFGGQQNYIIRIRYLLGSREPAVTSWLGVGPWQTYNFQGGASYGLTLPEHEFHITEYASDAFIAIEFNCSRVSGIENTFSLNHYNFHYGYGNPNSPEYPAYSKPDTGVAEDLDDIETELKNQSSEGLNTANTYFSGFLDTIQPYSKGLLFVANVMNLSIDTIPFIGHLFGISLALGLFGFILGLAGAIAGARDDSGAKVHNFARRDAKSVKHDGIASHRPSRRR